MATLEELMALRDQIGGQDAPQAGSIPQITVHPRDNFTPGPPAPIGGQEDDNGVTALPPIDVEAGNENAPASPAPQPGEEPVDDAITTPTGGGLGGAGAAQTGPNVNSNSQSSDVSLDQLLKLRAQVSGDNGTPSAPEEAAEPGLEDPVEKFASALMSPVKAGFNALPGKVQGLIKGSDVPDDQSTAPDSPIMNFNAGAQRVIAHTLGFPQELVDSALRVSGIAKLAPTFFNQNPGDAMKQMANRFNRMGIFTRPGYEGLASRIGDEAAQGVVTTSLMLAAAPAMVAAKGASAVKMISRWMGQALVDHPYLAMIQAGPSAAGAVVSGDTFGPWAAFPGAIAGGAAASAVGSVARLPFKAVSSVLDRIYIRPPGVPQNTPIDLRGNLHAPPQRPTAALRDAFAEPERATIYGEQQVEGARMHMEDEVKKAILSVRPTMNVKAAQAQVRKLLGDAEDIGNRIVSDFWKRTPLKTRVPMGELAGDVSKMRREFNSLTGTPSAAPNEMMDKIADLALPKRDPATGQLQPVPLPTVQRMRDLQGEIRRARLNEEGKAYSGLPVNDALVRNYNRLASMIDDAVMRAIPGDTSVQQARAASIIYHDIFSRGNLADILARRARGDNKFRPDETVQELMDRYDGLSDLLKVHAKVRAMGRRQPTLANANPSMLTQKDTQTFYDLKEAAEQSIRGLFQKAAQDMEPATAQKFIKANQEQIAPLAKVSAELQKVSETLTTIVEDRKILEKSALARFVKMDPQKAIQRVWNDPNPSVVSKDLIKTFQGDEEALEGYRAGLMDELFSRTKMDPNRMLEHLDTPKLRRLFEATFSEEQMTRLSRMVTLTAKLQNGNKDDLKAHFLPTARIIARILGAQVGRVIGRLTGGGTIQTPGIISQYAQSGVVKALKGFDPKWLLSKAVLDPKWEQLLYSRMPWNTKDLQNTLALVRKVVRTEQGGRVAARLKMEQERNEDQSSEQPVSP